MLVGLRQTFLEPPTVVRIDPKSKQATKLSAVNDALLAGTALGTYESVTYAGANGEPIQMWVIYPPGFDKTKKYPVFLLIHGGPHNAITNAMQFRWNAQVFGSWGYVDRLAELPRLVGVRQRVHRLDQPAAGRAALSRT